MIVFQHRAWQLLTTYEKLVGSWPYQSKIKNFTLRFLLFLFIMSAFVTLWIRTKKELGGPNTLIVVENSVALLLMILVLVKLIMPAIYEKQRCQMYEQVVEHFNSITDKEEVLVLQKYSNEGLRFCFIYTGMLASSCAMFYILPIAKMYYDYFTGQSGLEKKVPLYVDYVFFNAEDYFYFVLIHMFMWFSVSIINDFAFDLSFIIGVRHICALFEIVRMRLKKASDILSELKKSEDSEDSIKEVDNHLTSAIDMHNEVLHMAALVEEAYNLSWFIVLILNTITVGITLLAHSLVLDNPFVLVRYVMAMIMLLVHFYVIFSQGQRVIDSSSSVFDACYDCIWYNAPKQSCTLLSVIMSRSFKPSVITGGKGIFNLSMETYSEMLKLGFSMFTMFRTLQQKRSATLG